MLKKREVDGLPERCKSSTGFMNQPTPQFRRILGIEGGGTKTDWVLLDESHRILQEGQLPASNLKLSTDTELARLFSVLPHEVTDVGVFLAGCLMEHDRTRLLRLVQTAWPDAHHVVGSDRDSGFVTALGKEDGIIVISGTGAVVQGRKGGRSDKAGGWGHILGDRGGGYDVARHALRKVILRYDLEKTLTPLATAILSDLGLSELPQLVDWVNQADKMQVARLAPVIFRAAEAGDEDMRELINHRARDLANFTFAVAQRLDLCTKPVKVRLLGGLLTKEPAYVEQYEDYLSKLLPDAEIGLCIRSGAFGAATLAAEEITAAIPGATTPTLSKKSTEELAQAVTEQLHPKAEELDAMGAGELVKLFIEEEDQVRVALAACAKPLGQAVMEVFTALKAGGRLFYFGAGTSGRLGVLDSSEIPPTFGTSSDVVQGIIAGGSSAFFKAAEGAEDSGAAGALAVQERGVCEKDVVCGITASGRTPFVLSALERASRLGARTILITCNPARQLLEQSPNINIDLPTGPEIIAGSTRLKAGTATKVALNIISSCAMILLGKIKGGAMVNLKATNAKLRDRALRIVQSSLRMDESTARTLLEKSGWDIKSALAEHR